MNTVGRQRPSGPAGRRPFRHRFHFNFFLFFLCVYAGFVIYQFRTTAREMQVIPYSQFQHWLEQGKIKNVQIMQDQMTGELRAPESNQKRYFTTVRVEPNLAAKLDQHGVTFSRRIQSHWLETLLSWVLPGIIFFGLWMWVLRRALGKQADIGAGLMSIGKSKAKIYVQTDTKTTFHDVAGVDEAVEELKEVVDFLKHPADYGRLGGRMPKGVLLVGPPGTGKTLLAKAVAGEASVPFFSISGSEFVEMFVGIGAARVRDLFEQARKQAPCIIFIDELDALGRSRGAAHPWAGGNDEKEQTLNQLLVEMDGFDSRSGLILLAATNRPEILDPALLRAGRFDRQVLVDRPDKRGREAILRIYMKHVSLDPDADPEKIAGLTPGFTGADLSNLVNEATLVATRRKADSVNLADFTNAIERIVAGLEKKSRILNAEERQIVAHHEMGHALTAAALPGADRIHKVSIIPRGIGSLGYTIQRPTEDRFLMTREELENKMAVLLGGRAAEQIIFGRLSTGGHDDLGRVTEIARTMATRYGMLSELGQVTYEQESSPFLGPVEFRARPYSDATASRIDAAVQSLVDKTFQRTVALLEQNKELLKEAARVLLQKETLSEAELAPLFQRIHRPAAPSHPAASNEPVSPKPRDITPIAYRT